MSTVNLSSISNQNVKIKYMLSSLFNTTGEDVSFVKNEAFYANRVLNYAISFEEFTALKDVVKYIGVTERFKDVIDYFKAAEGETPAGFRVECVMEKGGLLLVDLVRDISYDKNGIKRPTNVLYSADSANPYEIFHIKDLIANLTCNPGIIYDLFINNPKQNIGNKFKDRDEVMEEIGRTLGPGCDISVELNDPFSKSDEELLEEADRFKKMLSPYRVVIKVPHTGPVNADNVNELLTGNKMFSKRYNQCTTKDAFRGHNLALMLREHGYRVNFTLMFEPYQTQLALLAKPYFINSFIRHRNAQSISIKKLLDMYKVTGDTEFLKQLKVLFMQKDYLSVVDENCDLLEIKAIAEGIVKYRKFDQNEGMDGLDSVRHNLRLLKNVNLPDTRLIVCSMEGESNYPDIDNLLTEDEFKDLVHRVVITAEPDYLARFTSCNQVVSYQRRFMNAANGQK